MRKISVREDNCKELVASLNSIKEPIFVDFSKAELRVLANLTRVPRINRGWTWN